MWIHRLSNINQQQRTGDCAVCGPSVPLSYLATRDKFRCLTAKRNSDRGRDYSGKQFRFKDGTLRPSQDEIDSMIQKQEGMCAICDEGLVEYHIDHCHQTGEIRGVLCPACNKGLGFFRDDAKRLAKAIDYLG